MSSSTLPNPSQSSLNRKSNGCFHPPTSCTRWHALSLTQQSYYFGYFCCIFYYIACLWLLFGSEYCKLDELWSRVNHWEHLILFSIFVVIPISEPWILVYTRYWSDTLTFCCATSVVVPCITSVHQSISQKFNSITIKGFRPVSAPISILGTRTAHC